MLNIFDIEQQMAFREKQAWISLSVTLIVYGIYFSYVYKALLAGQTFEVGGAITLAVIAIVVIQILLNIIAAVFSPHERGAPEDERERLIQQQANAGAFYVLQVAVMCAVVTVFFASGWSIANAALAAIVVGQIAKYILVIAGYRRGL